MPYRGSHRATQRQYNERKSEYQSLILRIIRDFFSSMLSKARAKTDFLRYSLYDMRRCFAVVSLLLLGNNRRTLSVNCLRLCKRVTSSNLDKCSVVNNSVFYLSNCWQ